MANEATVRTSLQIRKTSGQTTLLEYASQPSGFLATVTGTKGPTPGAMLASTTGTDVSLTQLTTPGLCRIMNQDVTNFVEVGIFDGVITFYPLMKLLAGESYVFRLSADVEAGAATLRIRANTAAVNVLVECFEV